jgi:hypothetical protein
MKIEVNCKHCNLPFVRINPRKIFCSRKCITSNWYLHNKEHKIAQSAKWHKENPDIRDDKHLRYKYGITLNVYLDMAKQQNNACKICNKIQQDRKLCIDHCHVTGNIRGLLCDKCNKGLGSFEDNELSLKNAVTYLQESRK